MSLAQHLPATIEHSGDQLRHDRLRVDAELRFETSGQDPNEVDHSSSRQPPPKASGNRLAPVELAHDPSGERGHRAGLYTDSKAAFCDSHGSVAKQKNPEKARSAAARKDRPGEE